MQCELSRQELQELVARQLTTLFLLREDERPFLYDAIDLALVSCEYCFARTDNKYYQKDGQPFFSPFHSGQYTIFLYFLARGLFTKTPSERSLCDRIYYLNRMLNGVDIYYEIAMPEVFFLDHPLGTVLGRATYGEGFRFAQQCTVGNNKGHYPIIGNNVIMMSGAKIIGQCHIGDNVIVAANTYIKDNDIPAGSLVFGSSPSLTIKPKR